MACDWLALDAAHVWHPCTRHGIVHEFTPIVRGEGASLVDADGRAAAGRDLVVVGHAARPRGAADRRGGRGAGAHAGAGGGVRAARGVLLRPLGSTVYPMSPYCATGDEVDTVYGVIEQFLEAR